MSSDQNISKIADLVVRVKQGNLDARGELIGLTQAPLFKFCLLLSGRREIAEDLCQEAFVKALQNIQKLKTPVTFLAWTYQIARNIFIDYKRSGAAKLTFTSDEIHESVGESSMDDVLTVQKILAEFEPDERFLLLLVELEGCSYKEAGELAGLSEDAVRSRLHRLRNLFMERFNRLKAP